jgi:outer membrane protein assembly factor BamD (BamD/ComL family)
MNITRVFTGLLIAVVIISIFAGCGRVRVEEGWTAEDLWRVAKDYFERERYLDAIELLTTFTLNYSGSTMIDSAQYLLAESHFSLKEYIVAESEYSRLIRNYPQSPLVDDSWVKIILCFFYLSPRYDLDQKNTERTIASVNDFLDEYPETNVEVRLSVKPTTWQSLRRVFTLGLWKPPRKTVEEVPLFRTKVVFPERGINFGQWLLRVFTLGFYQPRNELRIPPSQVVDGDWVAKRALQECRSRLAQKVFKAGELYYRQKKYPSVVIYADWVIELYAETSWASRAQKLKGDANFAMHKYQEAAQAYRLFLQSSSLEDRSVVENRLEQCLRQLQKEAASEISVEVENP